MISVILAQGTRELGVVDEDNNKHDTSKRSENHGHHCPYHGYSPLLSSYGIVDTKPKTCSLYRTHRHREECICEGQTDEPTAC